MLLTDIPVMETPLEATLRAHGLARQLQKVRRAEPLSASEATVLLAPTMDLWAVLALADRYRTQTRPSSQGAVTVCDWRRELDPAAWIDAVQQARSGGVVTVQPAETPTLADLRAVAVARLVLPPNVRLHVTGWGEVLTALAHHGGADPETNLERA